MFQKQGNPFAARAPIGQGNRMKSLAPQDGPYRHLLLGARPSCAIGIGFEQRRSGNE